MQQTFGGRGDHAAISGNNLSMMAGAHNAQKRCDAGRFALR
jgi:hypothetical protein